MLCEAMETTLVVPLAERTKYTIILFEGIESEPAVVLEFISPLIKELFGDDAQACFLPGTKHIALSFKDEESYLFHTLKHDNIAVYVLEACKLFFNYYFRNAGALGLLYKHLNKNGLF